MKIARRTPFLLALLPLLLVSIGSAEAQSLRGSRNSIERMYRHAVSNGIYFYKTAGGIRDAERRGTFVRLSGNANYRLNRVSYPLVRPSTKTFVERLSAQYRQACGEKLVVTSGSRPKSMRLANGADRSVHPTGIALDLRRPRNGRCVSWLRRTLLQLEGAGLIEATEERSPAHFHVAVYPGPYAGYVKRRGGEVRTAAAEAERYRVRRGDSLWGIARRYSTTVESLKAANGLDTAFLRAGETIVIPGR